MEGIIYKKFVAYYFFVGWDCISLGFHVCLSMPNIELHLPFGFVRIGWHKVARGYEYISGKKIFGWT